MPKPVPSSTLVGVLSRHPQLAVAVLATAVTILPFPAAHAGTGGTEFDVFYDTIVDWAQGSLGKALALAMFLVGIGMGVVRGSVVAAVPAVAGALGLFVAPTIIDAIVTATLTDATLIAAATGEPVQLLLPAVEAALTTPL